MNAKQEGEVVLKYEKLTSKSRDLSKVQELYELSFPPNERGPLEALLDDGTSCSEIFVLYDDIFCGFISLLSCGDLSHIIYFAIEDELRGKGYGGQALNLLKTIKSECRILADLEMVTDVADNNLQRTKRKAFYTKNGYKESNVKYDWNGDCYEILVSGGDIAEDEFWNFWETVNNVNANFDKF